MPGKTHILWSVWAMVAWVAWVACSSENNHLTILEAPTHLQSTAGDRQVTLSWQASDIADLNHYIIRIDAADTVPDELVVPAPAAAVSVKNLVNNRTYRFSIAAETTTNQRSPYSEPVAATPRAASRGGDVGQAKVSTPTGFVAVGGDASATLSWNANPDRELKGYTVFWGTDAALLPHTKEVDAAGRTTSIGNLVNDTTYFFAIVATNRNGDVSDRSNIEVATPTATPTQPVVETIAVEGNGLGLQVRQGSSFAFLIHGQRLGAVSATLGGLVATVTSNTDTQARLEFTVPHGHALGSLALLLTTEGGTTLKSDAVEVSPIAASKVSRFTPSDTNLGTKERPFSTLSKALSVASTGDTIFLGPGTYEGENWPVAVGGTFPPSIAPNVPDGITIIGQSGVVLQGPGSATTTSALVFAGSATVKNIAIREFHRGLVHVFTEQGCAGDITLDKVEAHENHDGLFSWGSCSLHVNDSSFVANGNGGHGSGMTVLGDGVTVAVTNSVFSDNVYGINTGFSRSLAVTDVRVTDSQSTGLNLGSHESVTLDRVVTSNNQGNGIEIVLSENTGFRMRSSEVIGNDGVGIRFTGYISFQGSVDLGTEQDGGNNTLRGNGDWQLHDNRDADTAVTIQAQGNSIGALGDPITPVGTHAGPSESSLGAAKVWRIERQGNSIRF